MPTNKILLDSPFQHLGECHRSDGHGKAPVPVQCGSSVLTAKANPLDTPAILFQVSVNTNN